MATLFRTSIRHHLSRRSRVLLTTCGVAAAVALLFATTLLNSTLRTSIAKSAGGIGGSADFEVIDPVSAGITPNLERSVDHVQGVGAIIPVLRMTAKVRIGDELTRTLVLGVPPGYADLFPDEPRSAERGLHELDTDEALLGPALAGDTENPTVRLQSPSGYRSVEAIGESALPSRDLNGGAFVVLGLETARRMFNRGRRSDVLYVVATGQMSRGVLRMRLDATLKGRAVLAVPTDQATAYRQTFDSLAQLSELGAAGALWVAIFAVYTAMSMSLLERRQTVALLSTLGATRRQLGATFIGEALLFGFLGSALGMALGYLLAKLLLSNALAAYPFLPLASTSRVDITPQIVLLTLSISLLVSVLGAAVPVRRTLRASPVEAMSSDAAYEWSASRSSTRSRATRLLLGVALLLLVAASMQFDSTFDSGAWAALSLALLLTGVMLALPPVVQALLSALEFPIRRAAGSTGLLAIGALSKSRGRTILVAGILALSLSLAVALSAALFSFEAAMTKVFTDRYGPPLYVTAASYTGVTSDQPLSDRTIGEVRSLPGVRRVYPERYTPFELGDSQIISVSAPMTREAEDGFSNALANTRGRSLSALAAGLAGGGVVLSTYTADLHDVDIGDPFPLPGLPRSRTPVVVGLYDDILSIETMYMERSTYLKISGDRTVDRLAVAPSAEITNSALAQRLNRFLRRERIPADVETRDELVNGILSNVKGAFAIARAIQLAALLIAGLIMASTMFTTVSERRWELAVCRALGMSRRTVRRAVLLEALVLGLIGSAIALVVGLAMGRLMLDVMGSRFLWVIGFTPSWPELGAAAALAIAAVMAAAWLPARVAGRSSVTGALNDT